MKNVFKGLLAPIAKPLLTKIHRFKDKHQGESCYVMGGGISLKWFDLGAFSGKSTIPMAFVRQIIPCSFRMSVFFDRRFRTNSNRPNTLNITKITTGK